MERSSRQPRRASFLAIAALIAGVLGTFLYAFEDQPAQAQDESCRRNIGLGYYGGGGPPEFTGVEGSGQYEPTVISGKGTAAEKTRDLLDIGNSSDSLTCNWSVQSISVDWITMDVSSGAVGPGSGQLVQVSINDNANALSPGTHLGEIHFAMEGGRPWTGKVTLRILETCRIGIRDDTGILAVDDQLYTKWDGIKGRRPNPQNKFTRKLPVVNISDSICDWIIKANASWISISPQDIGRLPTRGASVVLSLFANDKFLELPEGRHQAEVILTDSSGNVNRRIEIELELERPPCELHIVENARLDASGETGGPFQNRFALFEIFNRGDVQCLWNANYSETWIEIEPVNGLIGENGSTTVTIGIREAEAVALGPGNHETEVVFSAGDRSPTPAIPVRLAVHKLPCDFSVSERDPLQFSGYAGGTFTPLAEEFIISNADGRRDCQWNAVSMPDWISITPTKGTLTDGQQIPVQVATTDSASQLSAQSIPYTGTIKFDANTEIRGNSEIHLKLQVDCPSTEPCYLLHTTHTVITEGDRAEFSLSIVNPPSKSEMTAQLRLNIPSGWQAEAGGDECVAQCVRIFTVRAGGNEEITVFATPSHVGNFSLRGNLSWRYGDGDDEIGAISNPLEIPIAVKAATRDDESRNPTATVVTPAPTSTPPVGGSVTITPTELPPTLTAATVPPATPNGNGDDVYLIVGAVLLVAIIILIVGAVLLVAIILTRRPRVVAPPQGGSPTQPPTPNRRR